MKTRTELALAACNDLTDQELASRGTGGFKAMIKRKRDYALVARVMTLRSTQQAKLINALELEIAQLKAIIHTMDEMDKPVIVTADTKAMIAKACGSSIH